MMRRLLLIPKVAVLGLIFLRELILSSLAVARDVLRPGHAYRSAIVGVPLDLRNDAQITVLANMVTLTPGTTSLFISDDHETLYVHVMDTPSPEATIASIKDGFEKKVMETFR